MVVTPIIYFFIYKFILSGLSSRRRDPGCNKLQCSLDECITIWTCGRWWLTLSMPLQLRFDFSNAEGSVLTSKLTFTWTFTSQVNPY